MDRSAAVALIQQGLGFRTDLETQAIAALQEAQREFEIGSTLPWFLVEEAATLTTVIDSHTITFPTGFLRLVEDDGPYVDSADDGIYYLSIRPYDEALRYYASNDAGPPLALAVRSNSFAVFPLPDDEYSITCSYYKAADVLDTDIENAWLANVPDMMVSRAGMLLAADLESSSSYQKFAEKYKFWSQKYFAEIAARADQNMPRQMGVNN